MNIPGDDCYLLASVLRQEEKAALDKVTDGKVPIRVFQFWMIVNLRFCVGDRFFLCDNKILCEYDYEERMVFANLAYNSNNLAQIKQQAASRGQQNSKVSRRGSFRILDGGRVLSA